MSPETSRKRNVFSNRNFRLVFYGALVSELGSILYSFSVGFYILEITENNAFLQGLYLALCGASLLIFTPVGGVLGDRFHKARIMFLCDYAKGAMILLVTLLLLLFRSPGIQVVLLFILGILGNAVSGIFSPAAGALFPHIVEEEQLQQANAYVSMKNSLEGIVGIVLAGILYAALPIHILFFLVGLSYIASGISEMLIRYDHQSSPEPLTLRLAARDIVDGVHYLQTKPAILALLGSVLFVNFFFSPITGNFLPYFIKTDLSNASSYLLDRLLTPELWLSVFEVCFGLTSLLGAGILSARSSEEKVGRKTALRLLLTSLCTLGLTLAYWLLVDRGGFISGFLICFSLGCLLMGLLLSFINIPLNTTLMRVVDRDKLSKVASLISIASQGMVPIASVLAGLVLEHLGSSALLLICSLGFLVSSLMLLFNRRVREI
ncbi:MAG: MFS transporter [Firmicutes bacterium]|nr:MFS transporter [Bacillota bacterium]